MKILHVPLEPTMKGGVGRHIKQLASLDPNIETKTIEEYIQLKGSDLEKYDIVHTHAEPTCIQHTHNLRS